MKNSHKDMILRIAAPFPKKVAIFIFITSTILAVVLTALDLHYR